jgi:hypothetical protein
MTKSELSGFTPVLWAAATLIGYHEGSAGRIEDNALDLKVLKGLSVLVLEETYRVKNYYDEKKRYRNGSQSS